MVLKILYCGFPTTTLYPQFSMSNIVYMRALKLRNIFTEKGCVYYQKSSTNYDRTEIQSQTVKEDKVNIKWKHSNPVHENFIRKGDYV